MWAACKIRNASIYTFVSLWVNGATVSKCMAAMNERLQGAFKLDLIFKCLLSAWSSIYVDIHLAADIHATAVDWSSVLAPDLSVSEIGIYNFIKSQHPEIL